MIEKAKQDRYYMVLIKFLFVELQHITSYMYSYICSLYLSMVY